MNKGLIQSVLEKLFGPNYRTTVTGLLAAFFAIMAVLSSKPEFIAPPFPEFLRNIVVIIGRIVLALLPEGTKADSVVTIFVVLAGGFYGAQAFFTKDKSVTGGTVAATDEAKKRTGE